MLKDRSTLQQLGQVLAKIIGQAGPADSASSSPYDAAHEPQEEALQVQPQDQQQQQNTDYFADPAAMKYMDPSTLYGVADADSSQEVDSVIAVPATDTVIAVPSTIGAIAEPAKGGVIAVPNKLAAVMAALPGGKHAPTEPEYSGRAALQRSAARPADHMRKAPKAKKRPQ